MTRSDLLTLAIPTRNRIAFLRRLLAYYAACEFKFRILVLDSSDDGQKDRLKAVIDENASRLDIELLSYDADMLAMKKMEQCLSLVSSPFVVFCADDDFHEIEGIDQAVDFLSANADYVAAQGRQVVFTVNDGVFAARLRRSQPDLDMEKPGDRLYHHLSNYRPTFYAVHRTEVMKKCLADNIELFSGDLNWTELLPSCRATIQGKIKRLDCIHDVRQSHPSQEHHRLPTFGDWVLRSDFHAEYERFQDALASSLAEQDGGDSVEAKETVQRSFLSYLSTYLGSRHAPHGWKLPYSSEALDAEEMKSISSIEDFALEKFE